MDKYFAWKKKENILRNEFFSWKINYPLNEKQLEKIKNFFLYFFPVYQSFVDISKGDEIKFSDYISKIQDYHFTVLNNKKQNIKSIDKTSIKQEIDLKKFAEQKIKVLPGVRWQVFQRDGWKCVSCGRFADEGIILHVDHIIPCSKGELDILSNYQTLCSICNIGKSNEDETDIRLMRK